MADDLSCNLDLLRAVVGKSVKLNASGFGLCPFHEDKSPSFNIFLASSGKARYHCFGCGAGGDIFDYLQQTEKLGYALARQYLLGVTPTPVSSGPSGVSGCNSAGEVIPFCERDCPKYALLREDYYHALEELHRLRGPLPPP